MGFIYKLFNANDPKDLIHKAFVTKTRDTKIQFFRYLFVGGFSAVVNLGLFSLLIYLGLHYLLAELIAFVVATIVNYVLSIIWIFQRSSRFKLEFTLFTLVGVGGLGINELVLWLCVSKLGIYKVVSEAIAIAVVTLWSFALRKILFDKLN